MALLPTKFRDIVNALGFFGSSLTPIERVTSGIPVIDTNHAQIHAGNAFSLIGTMDVAQSQTGVLQISVPAATYVHFQAADIFSNAGPVNVSLIEDAALTSEVGASDLLPNNHHRIDNTASVLAVKALANAGVTNGSAVVTLATMPLFGTASGVTKVGASVSNSQEWILKPSKKYLLVLPGITGGIKYGFNIFWYEEAGA